MKVVHRMNLSSMKSVDIRTVDKSTLTDLRDIRIAKDDQNRLDIEDLYKQTPNFYCYRVGDIVVGFDYTDNGRSVNDLFSMMVQSSM